MVNVKLVLAVIVTGLVALTLFSSSADSDSKVDCSGLNKWNSNTSYKKGDLVTAKSGVSEYDAKFKCIKEKCQGVGDNQPSYDMGKTWENLGACKK